jgi:hypothetical protein
VAEDTVVDAPLVGDEADDQKEFEAVLREECEARAVGHGDGAGGARRMLQVLDMPESRRRTRILHRLKGHAREHLVTMGAVGPTEKINWRDKKVGGSIDWNKFFMGLIQLLTTILPLILQFIK